jgi:hypothetical protein
VLLRISSLKFSIHCWDSLLRLFDLTKLAKFCFTNLLVVKVWLSFAEICLFALILFLKLDESTWYDCDAAEKLTLRDATTASSEKIEPDIVLNLPAILFSPPIALLIDTIDDDTDEV